MPDQVRQDMEGGVCLMVFSRNTLCPYIRVLAGLTRKLILSDDAMDGYFET